MIQEAAPHLERHIQCGMLGYGRCHYRDPSGREGDWFRIGLASNKRYISLYVTAADGHQYLAESYNDRLPKADIGKSCVRFKTPDDVDRDALTSLIREGAAASD